MNSDEKDLSRWLPSSVNEVKALGREHPEQVQGAGHRAQGRTQAVSQQQAISSLCSGQVINRIPSG
jgi:hypothetical protein